MPTTPGEVFTPREFVRGAAQSNQSFAFLLCLGNLSGVRGRTESSPTDTVKYLWLTKLSTSGRKVQTGIKWIGGNFGFTGLSCTSGLIFASRRFLSIFTVVSCRFPGRRRHRLLPTAAADGPVGMAPEADHRPRLRRLVAHLLQREGDGDHTIAEG